MCKQHKHMRCYQFFIFSYCKFCCKKHKTRIRAERLLTATLSYRFIPLLTVLCFSFTQPQINSSTAVVKQIRYEINYMIITLQLPESRISSSYYRRLLLYLLCLFIYFFNPLILLVF